MRRTRAGAGWATWIGAAALCATLPGNPAFAQVRSVDPDSAIDAPSAPQRETAPAPDAAPQADAAPADAQSMPQGGAADGAPLTAEGRTPTPAMSRGDDTYHEDDLIGAAQGVFGKGAKGIAEAIRSILRKQGEPNGYIVGREGGGAFVVGLRYGSGTLHHKIEGERPVYWTGPSVGFDAGGSAGSAFVLVYNLYDTQDLFQRFPAGEGQAYLIGGFNISYLRAGNIVLVPVRLGVGLRLGANVGYMKFSHKQNWVPF